MARGEVLVVLGRKDAEIRGCLDGNLSGCGRFPRCEIYKVSNGNSNISTLPNPMMEGECLL